MYRLNCGLWRAVTAGAGLAAATGSEQLQSTHDVIANHPLTRPKARTRHLAAVWLTNYYVRYKLVEMALSVKRNCYCTNNHCTFLPEYSYDVSLCRRCSEG